MPLKRSELFARWGDLQHAQDNNAKAAGWADREHAIDLVRGAYLDAVRFGAVEDEGESPTRAMSAGLGRRLEDAHRLVRAASRFVEARRCSRRTPPDE
jgi:hypothetical protein